MTNHTNHIVHKQILEIDVENQAIAAEVEKNASRICNEKMPELLNKIFDKLNLGDESLIIYSLKIDLHKLPFKDWESEFLSHCEKQIEKELREKKKLLHQNQSGDFKITGNDKLISSEQRILEIFFEFLRTGYISNLSGSFDILNFEKDIIHQLEENQKEKENIREKWGRFFTTNRHIINRLINQFTITFIHRFIKIIWNIDERNLERLNSEFRKLEKKVKPNTLVSKNPETMFYEGLFHAISLETGKLNHDELSSVCHNFWIESLAAKSDEIGKNKSHEGIDSNHTQNFNKQNDINKKSVLETQNADYYINNAGLIIAAPYFVQIFKELKYLHGNNFENEETQARAIHVTQYLVNGQEQVSEAFLPLNKLLCGWPIEKTIQKEITLTKNEKEEAEELLNAIIKNWQKLGNTSIAALRETFLQRNATLKFREGFNDWHLQVEYKEGIDILIEYLPWTISMLKLPWMPEPVYVEWI